MDLIFLSNFYNHHQGPLCRALAAQSGVSFRFLASGSISLERRAMWGEIRDFRILLSRRALRQSGSKHPMKFLQQMP